MRARLHVVVSCAVIAIAGCSRPSVEKLRDELIAGDDGVVRGAPSCGVDEAMHRAGKSCLDSIATWIGSKSGFREGEPDQAAAATAAILAMRGHGEAAPDARAWIFTIREGSGPGADALRIAVATRVAAEVAPVARALTSDADARALMKGVAASVPGACEAYARLGSGGDPEDKSVPPEARVDHSPCVQSDLDRASGPPLHGRYGLGVWRGAEGALALWKDVASALRAGTSSASQDTRGAIAPKLDAIEASLVRIATPKLAAPGGAAGAIDAHGDAGIPLSPPSP